MKDRRQVSTILAVTFLRFCPLLMHATSLPFNPSNPLAEPSPLNPPSPPHQGHLDLEQRAHQSAVQKYVLEVEAGGRLKMERAELDAKLMQMVMAQVRTACVLLMYGCCS